jgi:hypothetical protein
MRAAHVGRVIFGVAIAVGPLFASACIADVPDPDGTEPEEEDIGEVTQALVEGQCCNKCQFPSGCNAGLVCTTATDCSGFPGCKGRCCPTGETWCVARAKCVTPLEVCCSPWPECVDPP